MGESKRVCVCVHVHDSQACAYVCLSACTRVWEHLHGCMCVCEVLDVTSAISSFTADSIKRKISVTIKIWNRNKRVRIRYHTLLCFIDHEYRKTVGGDWKRDTKGACERKERERTTERESDRACKEGTSGVMITGLHQIPQQQSQSIGPA
jgi:hypothetical protein